MRPFCIAVLLLAAATYAGAQDPLSAARELYASAAYEEALATLARLQGRELAPAVLEQAEQYRAFSLFALGRTADAESVAEGLIRRNPTMELDATDASPRLAEMFDDVRRRLLPGLVREHYREARAAIDRKDFATAEPQLARVERMLDEADAIDVLDESLADLRVLVDGFLELARTLQANARAAERAAVEAAQPPAKTALNETAQESLPIGQGGPEVTAPLAILQDIPAVPPSLMPLFRSGRTTGMLDVLIDEGGNVERSAIRQSLNPAYDEIVLRASKVWKYRAATRGDVPIKYLKTIAIVVQK